MVETAAPTGWICPLCSVANAPTNTVCACSPVTEPVPMYNFDDAIDEFTKTSEADRTASGLCTKHRRFPCSVCGIYHFDGCKCTFCRPEGS